MATARKAKGKKSQAISDISGFKVPYKELQTTWEGFRVEPEEYDPKHPQLTPPRNVIDATALFKPRPDTDPENVTVFIGYNYDPFIPIQQRPPVGVPSFGRVGLAEFAQEKSVNGVSGSGAIGNHFISIYTQPDVTPVTSDGAVGTSTLEAQLTETGVAATGAVGDETPEAGIEQTGLSATGVIGTETLNVDRIFDVTGTAATGVAGDEVPESELAETGVAATGAVGDEVPESEISESGVAATGAVEAVGEEGDGNVQIFNTGVVGHSAIGNVGEENVTTIINESNNTAWGEQGFGADSWGGQPEIVGVGEIGTVSIDIFNGPTSISGVSATGNVGSETPEAGVVETGVSATGNVGEETLVINSTFNATGISSTGNTGTVSAIVNPAFGQGDWGDGEWGE